MLFDNLVVVDRREGDLSFKPNVIEHDYSHISMGDLHGNAMKLIYTLVEEEVLDLKPAHYQKLWGIYKKNVDDLTENDMRVFGETVQNIKIKANERTIVLVGDELADRGQNDFFTLLVLEKLNQAGCDFQIMLSNHSAEFIRDFDKPHFTGQYRLGKEQGRSLNNMFCLIRKGLVSEQEVRPIVKASYIPHVRAMTWARHGNDSLTIFTHAPVGLETIKGLASELNVLYQDTEVNQLVHTVDEVNKKVQSLFRRSQLSIMIDREPTLNPEKPADPISQPFQRLIWNRALGDELEVKPQGDFDVSFVHGHIGDGPSKNIRNEVLLTHQNIDNSFGKFPEFYKTGFHPAIGAVKQVTRRSRETSNLSS